MGAREVLVIGIGNPERGDDAAGRRAAQLLRQAAPAHARVLEHGGEASTLLDAWTGARHVILIDAMQTGCAPGTVHRFDARAAPLPRHAVHFSTHGFGPHEAIEMARALGALPQQLIVYGIEARGFEPSAGLSEPVVRALPALVRKISSEIERIKCLPEKWTQTP